MGAKRGRELKTDRMRQTMVWMNPKTPGKNAWPVWKRSARNGLRNTADSRDGTAERMDQEKQKRRRKQRSPMSRQL